MISANLLTSITSVNLGVELYFTDIIFVYI